MGDESDRSEMDDRVGSKRLQQALNGLRIGQFERDEILPALATRGADRLVPAAAQRLDHIASGETVGPGDENTAHPSSSRI